ncbi:MAG: alanine dehydrogenase [Betaproteobacteria bacterium]
MRIGVPRERKDGERRVGLVPENVRELVAAGHEVLVERDAGVRVGFDNGSYAACGAILEPATDRIFACPLIVKVKELQPAEFALLSRGTAVFGFAQLGRDRALQDAVLAAHVACIAYETVAGPEQTLPLLSPMSRIAGRLAPFIGASLLMTDRGGGGVLLSTIDGVPAASVTIVGAGVVAREAALLAADLGAKVRVLGRSATRLDTLRVACGDRILTAPAEPDAIAAAIRESDLVVGAVLQPGALSPKLISRRMLSLMRPGSVFIDVGIDQGGIAETSRMTSLSNPTYVEEGVIHYCVPNMPALVARTATLALTQATLPYVLLLANLGIDAALAADGGLRAGLQVRDGEVTHPALAADRARAQKGIRSS